MRYQQIHSTIWRDSKFKALSEPAQRLFIYCMTSPNSNSLGIYQAAEKWILQDLKWNTKGKKRTYNAAKLELKEVNLAHFDTKQDLICVCNQLKYNPLRNPNAVKSALNALKSLPLSDIIQYLNIEPLTEPFQQPLREQLRQQLSHSISLTLTYPLQEQSQDNELEKKGKALLDELKIGGPDFDESTASPDIEPF